MTTINDTEGWVPTRLLDGVALKLDDDGWTYADGSTLSLDDERRIAEHLAHRAYHRDRGSVWYDPAPGDWQLLPDGMIVNRVALARDGHGHVLSPEMTREEAFFQAKSLNWTGISWHHPETGDVVEEKF